MPVKTRRWILLGYAAIIAFAVARVRATERVFSATADEPAHIACGLDWLTGRPYVGDVNHPPLARAIAALPAALARTRVPESSADLTRRGNEILYSGDYVGNLRRARAGNLLFLVIAIGAVGAWGTRRLGPVGGLIAAAVFAWLPPVRAHAGLATTDMAATALFPLALVMLDRWLDSPTLLRGAALGAAIGAGLISKYSFFLFFGIAAAILIALRLFRGWKISIPSAAIAAVVAAFIVWGGFRFETGTVDASAPEAAVIVHDVSPAFLRAPSEWFASTVRMPAPLFVTGLAAIERYDHAGHVGFLFGRIREHGWWYYFPVALFFKTPLPFLLLAAAGIAVILARRRSALDVPLIALAMLLSVLPSSINIGVRHVLPLYAPLAMAAAAGVLAMGKTVSGRLTVAVLLGWLVGGTELAHPDYLPWFNEAAGAHPERILSDSNLDWGQDYLRLARVLNERPLDRVSILFGGSLVLQKHVHPGIEGGAIVAWREAPGWYVLAETPLAINPEAVAGGYRWLEKYPYERIGKSIRLYHVPE